MSRLKFSSLLFLCCPLFIHAQQNRPDIVAIQNGVSENLAIYRAKILSKLSYNLTFKIPAAINESIPASDEIEFILKNTALPLQIDFKGNKADIYKLLVNGKHIPVTYTNEHIVIKSQFLIKGGNKVIISFIAGSSSLNRNNDYLYSLLVPDRARTVFPCFDQPDLKAIFKLTLSIPHNWKTLANAPVKDSVAEANGNITYHFLPSDKISTYLFSFVAGKFYRSTKRINGRLFNFYYRETDSLKLKSSIDPIFNIQADAIKFMEGYTGIKFPFQKFDFVAIPDFQYGGMEHVGAIQYKAAALFLDESATKDQLITRANVLAHETAHMWFGDLVSIRWFDDVWMKEVFANFMADKIGNITFKDNNYKLKFFTDHYSLAYSVDHTAGTTPIRQPLDNLQDAGSLYGNIIYQKAPIMMRQLEKLMGAEHFRDGIREYLKKYAYQNASWPDLIAILGAHTTTNLQAWNNVWVNQSGRPQFTYTIKTSGRKIENLTINQKGEDGTDRVWPQYFEITMVYPDRTEELQVNMDKSSINLTSAIGKAKPLCILFNSSGEGYGLFPVDSVSLEYLSALKSPLMRASAYINLYENMLNGHIIAPAALLKLDQQLLLTEPEELNLNILIDQTSSLFWRFTPYTQWSEQAPGFENILWQGMQQANTSNEKKLFFKAFSGIAFTKSAQDTLFKIWKNKHIPFGITLTEDDYTNLATALAIRNYPGYQEILNEQLARIQNPDRKQRLQYLMPSLSNDTLIRDTFFASLKEAKNRRKESQVAMALTYLHHPLRTAYSEKYLQTSLDLLAEIQLTGDIFFPQSWLSTTLNWYQTPTAAKTIRDFLRNHPDYNPKLRAKILQSADNVFRAEQLVNRH